MPLPGFNPLEQAPPPGSTEIAASAAQAARLHQRISDLERRLSDTETGRGSGWAAISGIVYATNWGSFSTAYTPSYRIEGRTVHLAGIIKTLAAPPSTLMGTLPDYLRPEWPVAGQGPTNPAMQLAVNIQTSTANTAGVMIIYPRDSSAAGQMVSSSMTGAQAGWWVSLFGISYLRRTDM